MEFSASRSAPFSDSSSSSCTTAVCLKRAAMSSAIFPRSFLALTSTPFSNSSSQSPEWGRNYVYSITQPMRRAPFRKELRANHVPQGSQYPFLRWPLTSLSTNSGALYKNKSAFCNHFFGARLDAWTKKNIDYIFFNISLSFLCSGKLINAIYQKSAFSLLLPNILFFSIFLDWVYKTSILWGWSDFFLLLILNQFNYDSPSTIYQHGRAKQFHYQWWDIRGRHVSRRHRTSRHGTSRPVC